MTQSDVIGIVEIAMWGGLWFWIARRLKRRGSGALTRNLAGAMGGAVVTLSLFAALFHFKVLDANPKTFNLTPEQYAAQLNPLLQEWQHHPQLDPQNLTKGKDFDIISAELDPYTTLHVGVSRSTGKVFRVFVDGSFKGDMRAFDHMARLASAALAATHRGTTTDEVYGQLSEMADGRAVVFGEVSMTSEMTPGVGRKFYAEPL
ncbi:MAG: hypothetical protein LBJ37_12010 [Paucimonas sp.]|jgi:hypothetical protein|nr:hypothetical protein [Paucimonas sp.]